jgi:DNA-binding NtrC family response regulator
MPRQLTHQKLKAMLLDGMATAWKEQNRKPEIAGLSFDERFGMLVDAEWVHRENQGLIAAVCEDKVHSSLECYALAKLDGAEHNGSYLQGARDVLLLAAHEGIGRIGVKEAQKALRVEMFREALRRERGNRHAVARILRVDRRYVLKMLKENGGFKR